jgi:hypothetical protein
MRYALTYGGIAGAIVVGFICASIAIGAPSHQSSELLGYLVMLLGLSLIFVGVKRYRDVECGGVIRFGRAFGLGLMMAAVAGLVYALGWELYLAVTGTDFMAGYTRSVLAGMKASGASAAAIAAKAAQLHQLTEMYRNPLLRMPMTFVEIFPVGLLVALVSAALLRNPRLLPLRRAVAA